MSDKILIGFAPMADYSSAAWGLLKKVDGQIVLDKVKAYNRARLMLNSGCNYFRILRRGIWSISFPFDWEDPGYFNLFREYVSILHQPFQGTPTGAGADVLVEIFDGCSESWMYDKANYGKARQLILAMFSNVGDLPWIKFGVGNELNAKPSVDFVGDVVYPVFKDVGRMPFSFGGTYSRKHDWLELQKKKAGALWGDEPVKYIYRQVHGIKDEHSENLFDAMIYYLEKRHGLCCILGCDGVKDGASECDDDGDGKKRRPSIIQLRASTRYILKGTIDFDLPGGHRKLGLEYVPTGINADSCFAEAVRAFSMEYKVKFGEWPENWGKYPDDWVEPPIPPEPEPPEPEPPAPPPEKKPWWYWWFGKNSLWSKAWRWLFGRY